MTGFIEDRIDTLEAKADSHSTRLMNLQDRIGFAEAWHDDHEKRIGVIDKQITELSQAALKAQCNGHEYLSDCIEELAKQIGTLQEAKIKTFARMNRLEASNDVAAGRLDKFVGRTHQAGKRAFKGGWINLYYGRGDTSVSVGSLCDTRQVADFAAGSTGNTTRIACIHITDFQEGEGL